MKGNHWGRTPVFSLQLPDFCIYPSGVPHLRNELLRGKYHRPQIADLRKEYAAGAKNGIEFLHKIVLFYLRNNGQNGSGKSPTVHAAGAAIAGCPLFRDGQCQR